MLNSALGESGLKLERIYLDTLLALSRWCSVRAYVIITNLQISIDCVAVVTRKKLCSARYTITRCGAEFMRAEKIRQNMLETFSMDDRMKVIRYSLLKVYSKPRTTFVLDFIY